MEHLRWTPFVAQIFEPNERRADLLGFLVIVRRTGIEQRTAVTRREDARASGESGEPELPQMNHRGPLADPADDAGCGDPLQEAGQVRVDRGILAYDGVLDASTNLGIHEAPE